MYHRAGAAPLGHKLCGENVTELSNPSCEKPFGTVKRSQPMGGGGGR